MRPWVLATLLGATAACDDTDPMASQPRAEAFGASAFFEDGRAMRPLVPGTVAQEWRAMRRAGRERREGLAPDGGWVQEVPEPLSRALLQEGRAHYETWCAVCHGVTGNGESIVATKMPQRRPPGLFVPHDHGTQVVYGMAEDEAPYSGTKARAEHVDPNPIPLPRELDAWGAVRETNTPLPPGEGRGEGSRPSAPSPSPMTARRDAGPPPAYSEAAAEHARNIALAGREGTSMEGLLRERPIPGDLPHPPGFYFSVISEGFGVMPAYSAELQPRERWAIVAYLRALSRSQHAPLSAAPPEIQTRLLQEGPSR